ncbi:hypothetical protein ACQPZQ_19650 [Pseudonocardia sp. CA-142604]|uniref:hypothetical protein n=1 Tax=Pseudonocardia sp. CA-142604 TaxID=3240024 RepID=UPI003D92D198
MIVAGSGFPPPQGRITESRGDLAASRSARPVAVAAVVRPEARIPKLTRVASVDPPRMLGEGFFADAQTGRGGLSAEPNQRNAHNHLSGHTAHPFIVFLCQQTMNEGVGVTSSQSRSGQAAAERSQEVSARQRYEDENTFAHLAVSEMQRDLQRVEDQARMAQQDAQASRQLAQHARSAAQQAQNQARQAQSQAQQAQGQAQQTQNLLQQAQNQAQQAQSEAQQANQRAQQAHAQVQQAQNQMQQAQNEAQQANQRAQQAQERADQANQQAQQAEDQAQQAHNMAQQAQTDSAQIRMNSRQFQRA